MKPDDILNNPIIAQFEKFLDKKFAKIMSAQDELKQKGYELTPYEQGFRNGMINLIVELRMHILLKVEISEKENK